MSRPFFVARCPVGVFVVLVDVDVVLVGVVGSGCWISWVVVRVCNLLVVVQWRVRPGQLWLMVAAGVGAVRVVVGNCGPWGLWLSLILISAPTRLA